MKKINNYHLSISRETKEKMIKAKVITLKATKDNLEKMLKMTQKLRYAKAKMVSYIFHDDGKKYTDIIYITNLSYSK